MRAMASWHRASVRTSIARESGAREDGGTARRPAGPAPVSVTRYRHKSEQSRKNGGLGSGGSALGCKMHSVPCPGRPLLDQDTHARTAPRVASGERPRLRVAAVASTYPRFHDDPLVPWLRESVGRLARRGHDMTVIAPSFSGLASHSIDGVPVRRFRYGMRAVETLTHDEGAPSKLGRNPLYK